ncbi:hypothetical protein TNCV_505631 [Trichonephila clavipes]|nr:hypothetical protein TNCV_505631 [Trichonephila clavipes]
MNRCINRVSSCCYLCRLIDSNIRPTEWIGASCTSVVSRRFEHHRGDSTIWYGIYTKQVNPHTFISENLHRNDHLPCSCSHKCGVEVRRGGASSGVVLVA